MAFPQVITANTNFIYDSVQSQATKIIPMPTNLQVDDLILIFYQCQDNGGGTTVNFGTNLGTFTKIVNGGTGITGTTTKFGVWYKWSDGTESGQTTTTSHTATTLNEYHVMSICVRGVNKTKTPTISFINRPATADTPSVTAPWGGSDNLFLSVIHESFAAANVYSASPTGYTLVHNYRQAGSHFFVMSSKQSVLATDDPAAFTLDVNPPTRTVGYTLVLGGTTPVPVINSINSGSPLSIGQKNITFSLTNFASTPNAITCTYSAGTQNLIISNISGNTTSITADLEDRTEGVDYPLIGTTLSFSVTDGVGTASGTSTILQKINEVSLTFASPISQYSSFFAYHFNADGFTTEGAEFNYIPYGDFILRTDSGYSASTYGIVTGWFRPTTGLGAGNVYYYSFNISAGGIIKNFGIPLKVSFAVDLSVDFSV